MQYGIYKHCTVLPVLQVLSSVKADRGLANDGLSSALLVVFLDSARSLPVRLALLKK